MNNDCGYLFDGVDDSVLFDISHMKPNPHEAYSISIWFKNTWKPLFGHIPQTIFVVGEGESKR